MKTIMQFMLYALLFTCCSDSSKDIYLNVSSDKISADSKGGVNKIEIKTNSSWIANCTEDWVQIDEERGTNNTIILISVDENKNKKDRQTQIIITNENADKAIITISQEGIDINNIEWADLNFSSFDNYSFIEGEDGQRTYTFKIYEQFINQYMNNDFENKIFLGNLVDRNLKSNTDIEVYGGYTFYPITLSPSIVSVKSKKIMPSIEAQNTYASQIISALSRQNESIIINHSGFIYKSYKQLNFIGISNMGVPLDEFISGKSYKTNEMSKENGIIYSFRVVKFSIYMDLPEYLVKEDLKKENFKNGLSYISTVGYGRIGLLLIESDEDADKVKPLVNRIFRGEKTFTSEEKIILNELDAYHIYIDKNNKLSSFKGKINAVESYGNQMNNSSDIYPLIFTVADYFTLGLESMSCSLTVH